MTGSATADRDPVLNPGQFTESAAAFLGDGFHGSVEEVLDDALRLLEKRREAFNAIPASWPFARDLSDLTL